MRRQTETAFSELLEAVDASRAGMVERRADDEATPLEAHAWVRSILERPRVEEQPVAAA